MSATFAQAGSFRPGDRVKILGGTFIGMEGRVVDVAEARRQWMLTANQNVAPDAMTEVDGCAWVIVSIFGRPVPVQVEDDLLRPA